MGIIKQYASLLSVVHLNAILKALPLAPHKFTANSEADVCSVSINQQSLNWHLRRLFLGCGHGHDRGDSTHDECYEEYGRIATHLAK